MVGVGEVWQMGYMLVCRAGLRDGDYVDALTGQRVPLSALPDDAVWVASDRDSLSDDVRGVVTHPSTLRRQERQRLGNHTDLLVALRAHAFEHSLCLSSLVDDVVHAHLRHQLFSQGTIHVIHLSPQINKTQIDVAAIVTLPHANKYDDALLSINTAITATTADRSGANWSLALHTSDQYQIEVMQVGVTTDNTISGARPTQTGDIMIHNGHTPYAMTEYGPVAIDYQNINALGLDTDIVRQAINLSLQCRVAPPHVLAARIMAAISTLAGTVGASPTDTITFLHGELTRYLYTDEAVNSLVKNYYADDATQIDADTALHYTRQLIDSAVLRWDRPNMIDPLLEAITTMTRLDASPLTGTTHNGARP